MKSLEEIYEEQNAAITESLSDDLREKAKSIAYALEDGETGASLPGLESVYKLATKLEDALFKAKSKINKLEA